MQSLFERVLSRLGFSDRPAPTPAGLGEIYHAWCQRVPFDNVRKLIHVRSGDTGPLPGSTVDDFFQAWLRHGTGGTCWSGAGACTALLRWIGFEAERGIGTMLAAPHLPPNHGTIRVRFGDEQYLVDCSILHDEPLRLDPNRETATAHPAWGVSCAPFEDRWMVRWRPLHKPEGFECRLERFGAEADEFHGLYDQTRGWSPFNYELTARTNRAHEVIGVSFGHRVTLRADGSVEQTPVTYANRQRFLVEQFGLSEEIVSQLPPDVPTPPPPGSKTAAATAR